MSKHKVHLALNADDSLCGIPGDLNIWALGVTCKRCLKIIDSFTAKSKAT